MCSHFQAIFSAKSKIQARGRIAVTCNFIFVPCSPLLSVGRAKNRSDIFAISLKYVRTDYLLSEQFRSTLCDLQKSIVATLITNRRVASPRFRIAAVSHNEFLRDVLSTKEKAYSAEFAKPRSSNVSVFARETLASA